MGRRDVKFKRTTSDEMGRRNNKDTYERGSVAGKKLIIRPTTASTSQTNPRENDNFGCKRIPEERGVCRVCNDKARGDAIMICKCDNSKYCIIHSGCQVTWLSGKARTCSTCKTNILISVTVEEEQIPEEKPNRSWVSAFKRRFNCVGSPRVMD